MRCSRSLDGLNVREREVLALWDAGRTLDQIAVETGYPRKLVQNYVSMFAGGSDGGFGAMVRRGSAALLDALHRHHPEQCSAARAPP